ncbi:uncharacterized protein TRAVEDRAFT_26610, partial [Trametes versicolor FP-101664 SS1]|uniref:uncharacterized protein n=1 Tax=Trametes versicolor (strain FP-101664) TaxID=717944 RepID=UPI00046235CB
FYIRHPNHAHAISLPAQRLSPTTVCHRDPFVSTLRVRWDPHDTPVDNRRRTECVAHLRRIRWPANICTAYIGALKGHQAPFLADIFRLLALPMFWEFKYHSPF